MMIPSSINESAAMSIRPLMLYLLTCRYPFHVSSSSSSTFSSGQPTSISSFTKQKLPFFLFPVWQDPAFVRFFLPFLPCFVVLQLLPQMATWLRTKSFVVDGGEASTVDAFEWWNEVDESEQWQKGIYYALCAAYGLISIVALVQLLRIQLRVPEYGWTTQKVFHLMNFVVNGLRAILFGVYKRVFLIRSRVLEMMIMELPGLLFFSTYTLLVLFWAEIYYQARSLPIDRFRPTYYILNGVIYVIQFCIWILVRLSESSTAVKVAKLFFSVISLCAALSFVIYGGRLFTLLRHFPIESRGRQKKLYEVGSVTLICCSCFLIRCFVVAISAFDAEADLDVLDHPILNFVYYMLVEIVPSALILFILRKLPPKRISDRYHPIQ